MSPNSLANLLKGSNLGKILNSDIKSQDMVISILEETVDYEGTEMTLRECLIRVQVDKAMAGDLRSCQFIFELAGHSEKPSAEVSVKTSPLEQLQQIMQESHISSDRREEAN